MIRIICIYTLAMASNPLPSPVQQHLAIPPIGPREGVYYTMQPSKRLAHRQRRIERRRRINCNLKDEDELIQRRRQINCNLKDEDELIQKTKTD